ncbi:MAG: hypothetical protein KBE16_00080 [Alphaproteobacteria bacterium]|jgi:prefoldin subunit 5|nr:hypothetical protein [Alphaproteobacteria bacterium]MBP9877776.1 hypothetical protein [Alphaproteobacteria bacterium]
MFTQQMPSPMTAKLLTIVLSVTFLLLIGLPFLNHYYEINLLERTLSNDAIAEKQKRLTEIEAILSNINYQQSLAHISKAQNTSTSEQHTPFTLLENKISKLKERRTQLKETLAKQEQQIEALIQQIEDLKERQAETHSEPA